MSRTILFAMVVGAVVGVGCKKSGDSSGTEPAKTQEGAAAKQEGTPSKNAAEWNADNAGVQAGGIERDDQEGPAALLSAANGTVEVRRLGETQWTAAQAATKLYAGDVVRTADGGTATITMADESVIEVAETTTIGIASRNGTADPASSAAVLGGIARFTVVARAPGEGPFRVYTPSAVVLTRGTTYGVGVAASGEARVGVETGIVDVIGLAQLDAAPVTVEKSAHVVIAADGKIGTAAAWPADDWGTWRDDTDARVEIAPAFELHASAMTDLDRALVDTYAELQANADAAATFEATASVSAEKGDQAAYTAALPDGAAAIDASFLLASRLETLTWAYAARGALATDLYVRHPAPLEAKWTVVAPKVDASVLWPKRFEITGTAYFEPLRAQYYVHHPRGRAHAHLVGIAVPEFYAQVEPPQVEAPAVRARLKGQIWATPELRYKASARPVWVATPSASWHAKVKVAAAPPRAKVAWYVRPPELKAKALVGVNATGAWKSSLNVQPPQPRAQLAAMWTIPVGMKIKVGPPDLSAAASARAKVKIGADGRFVSDHRVGIAAPDVRGNVKGNVKGKIAAPDVKGKVGAKVGVGVAAPDVKAGVGVKVRDHRGAAVGGAAGAGAGVTGKVDGAVKAGADVKVKVNVPPPPPPPAVKVEGKVKASGGFKIGN
jgi:hypothetical protein